MSSAVGVNLDQFFKDVEGIKNELKEIESLHHHLHQSHHKLRTICNPSAVKDIIFQMHSVVSTATKKAKLINFKLEALDHSNTSYCSFPGCGPGSTRTSVVVEGLREKLKDSMEAFDLLWLRINSKYAPDVQLLLRPSRTRTSNISGLRKKLKDSIEAFKLLRLELFNSSDYKETVKKFPRTYADKEGDDQMMMIEPLLMETNKSETVLGIQEQVMSGRVKDMEKRLLELHLEMALLVVDMQGEQLDDIESQIRGRPSSSKWFGVYRWVMFIIPLIVIAVVMFL